MTLEWVKNLAFARMPKIDAKWMNPEWVRNLAFARMPKIDAQVVGGTHRHEVIRTLAGANNIGIELGVAQGVFAERMLRSGKFARYFGVDRYGDPWGTPEYKAALKRIGLSAPFHLLRMTFEEALGLFEDEYFDFIYIDGFAETGEEGGRTLYGWYRKLKVGGVIAGDDYHPDWPLVMWAVNDFAARTGEPLFCTELTERIAYCNYPSWFLTKRAPFDKVAGPPPELVEVGRREGLRVHRQRTRPQLRRGMIRALEVMGVKESVKKLLRR
jgi:Methyltransferase domain